MSVHGEVKDQVAPPFVERARYQLPETRTSLPAWPRLGSLMPELGVVGGTTTSDWKVTRVPLAIRRARDASCPEFRARPRAGRGPAAAGWVGGTSPGPASGPGDGGTCRPSRSRAMAASNLARR